MFSDAGPDVRWCGNEKGIAGEPNWSTMNPDAVPYPGADGPGIIAALQHGDPRGGVWRPAEADTSIRPGWFYHPAEDARVRTDDELVQLYLSSVGRNSKLLLNVPPTRAGLLHDTDVARLAGMRAKLDRAFGREATVSAKVHSVAAGGVTREMELRLRAPARIGAIRLGERIERGQVVERYVVTGMVGGEWRELSRGATIGHARIDRIDPVTVSRLRVRADGFGERPSQIDVRLLAPA
jgi:alpha-L-fucosidase